MTIHLLTHNEELENKLNAAIQSHKKEIENLKVNHFNLLSQLTEKKVYSNEMILDVILLHNFSGIQFPLKLISYNRPFNFTYIYVFANAKTPPISSLIKE